VLTVTVGTSSAFAGVDKPPLVPLPSNVREDCWLRARPGEPAIPCELPLDVDRKGISRRAVQIRERTGGRRRGIAIQNSVGAADIIGAGRGTGALGTDLGWLAGWTILHPRDRENSLYQDALWLTPAEGERSKVGGPILLAAGGEEAENLDLYGDRRRGGLYNIMGLADTGRRFVALDLLARYDVTPVRRALIARLDDADELVRLAAAEALAASKVTEAADPIASWLAPGRADVSPFMRRQIALALGRLGSPAGVPALASALDDPAHEVREAAVIALGEIGGPESGRLIAGRVRDPDRRVRRAVAEALGQAGGPAAADSFRVLFSDPDERTRLLAVRAADKLELRALVPAFIERLHDTDGEVQYAAVGAVSTLRVREAVPHLLPLLGAKPPRETRRHALCFIPGTWLNLDCAAARALERLGDKAGLAEAQRRVPHCLAKP
jgi:hypothetical protein